MSVALIGKSIYSLLSNDNTIKGLVSTKIYPLVLPELTTLPSIVYDRSSNIEYTRDGAAIATSDILIKVISEDYNNAMDISEAVYNALNNYQGDAAGINVQIIRLTDIDEDFIENAYIEKLTFTCRSII